ncbi:hypothetical protein FS749_012957 [Ceratobasidium sp. UAMH 11750]|nr:hypothetical protein FS749_012957 [Ceratobasidium sp. UAMH 11750]
MSAQDLIAVKIEDTSEQKPQPVPESEQPAKEPKRKRARAEVDQDEVEEGREVSTATTSILNPIPGDRLWPFIAVRYEGRAIAMKRKFHYTEVIASIKMFYQSLRTTSDEQIRLVGVFQGFGDEPVEITAEVWPELAADLKTITVVYANEQAPRYSPPVDIDQRIVPGFTRPPGQPPTRTSVPKNMKMKPSSSRH